MEILAADCDQDIEPFGEMILGSMVKGVISDDVALLAIRPVPLAGGLVLHVSAEPRVLAPLDSAGVALVLRLAERLRARRRQLHLVVPRGSSVRRVFDLTGLPRVIPLEARLEDALARCDCGLPDDLA